MSRQVIHFSKKLLAFRRDAIKIKKECERNSFDTTIDFSEVHFISRAFADELLIVLEKLQQDGYKIQLKKMRPTLKKLLQAVKKTRKKINKELLAQQ